MYVVLDKGMEGGVIWGTEVAGSIITVAGDMEGEWSRYFDRLGGVYMVEVIGKSVVVVGMRWFSPDVRVHAG